MIVIHSSADDVSTPEVLDWLTYLNRDVSIECLNDTLPIDNLSIFIGDNGTKRSSIVINGEPIDITGITSSWYRRGELVIPASSQLKQWSRLSAFENNYVLHLVNELI